ncbi:MAG: hypothetical protein ACI8RZ_005057 [Myxococcota bacterium]
MLLRCPDNQEVVSAALGDWLSDGSQGTT